jgi:hypothetical protein
MKSPLTNPFANQHDENWAITHDPLKKQKIYK